jgi:hypothetical protein
MSQLLREFLSAYAAWVDAGAVQDKPFSRSVGLCSNFEEWLVIERSFSWAHTEDEIDVLKALFESEGLDRWYPFGGENLYQVDLENDTQHLNDSRLAWVRSKVAQHEVV